MASSRPQRVRVPDGSHSPTHAHLFPGRWCCRKANVPLWLFAGGGTQRPSMPGFSGSGAPGFNPLAPRQHAPPPPGLGGPHSHAPPPGSSMGRGNNGRNLGGPPPDMRGARSFGQPPAGRGRESPRDDYPRLNGGGPTSSLSRSRSEEPPQRTKPPTRFDKDFVRATPPPLLRVLYARRAKHCPLLRVSSRPWERTRGLVSEDRADLCKAWVGVQRRTGRRSSRCSSSLFSRPNRSSCRNRSRRTIHG